MVQYTCQEGKPERQKTAAPVVETETAERRHTMKTLRKHGGTWYAKGKPFDSLHDAVKALSD